MGGVTSQVVGSKIPGRRGTVAHLLSALVLVAFLFFHGFYTFFFRETHGKEIGSRSALHLLA